MSKDPITLLLGARRDLAPLVYILAAFIERNESAWVSDQAIRQAAILIVDGEVPVEASRCELTGDVVVRLKTKTKR